MTCSPGVFSSRAVNCDLTWCTATPDVGLTDDEVHLWRVATTPADTNATGAAWAVLCDAERRRALAYRDDRAARGFVVARAQVRAILGRYIGCEPGDVSFEEGPNGRPRVRSRERPSVQFSVSRVHGTALVAVVDGGEVGVDIERIPADDVRSSLPWNFVRDHAPPDLLRDLAWRQHDLVTFCIAWTRLEAYAKAFTDGLSGVSAPPLAAAQSYQVRSFRVSGDLVASLAEDGGAPRALRAFDGRDFAPAA